MSEDRLPAQRLPTLVVVSAIACCLLLYYVRLDAAAGFMVDDAWYILLARTLASGDGYHLSNGLTPGLLPSNPPGFPAVLSLGFLFNSQFPHNVPLLKMVSIAAVAGVGFLSYHYFTRYREVPAPFALGLACVILLTPSFVFLATSTVMSECVFTLALLATVLLVDRSSTREGGSYALLLAGAVAASSILVRSAGVPLVAGAVLHLSIQRRWRGAMIFCAGLVLVLAPWMLYARLHAPTNEERAAHGGAHAYAYSDQFWMKQAGSPSFGKITARDLPRRVKDGLTDVFGRDVAAIVTPALFRGGGESGLEVLSVSGGDFPSNMGGATGTMVLSLVLTGIAALGFVAASKRGLTTAEFVVPLSIGMIVLWPFPAIRFVVPLTPFLLFYLWRGVQAIASSSRGAAVARIAILCVIGLHLLDHSQHLMARRAGTDRWAAEVREVDSVLQWMSDNLPAEGYVATTNPALVHLRTGRRTVAIDDPPANWWVWKQRGVRYLVCLAPARLPPRVGPYKVLYRSPVQGFWVVEI